MKTSELLKDAKQVISKPENWTQGVYARDSDDKEIRPERTDACKFCMYGALRRNGGGFFSATEFLLLAVKEQCATDIVSYNDDPDRKHEEVMEVFDKAIKLAEEDELSIAEETV